MRLSVLLPVFNEERELATCLDQVLASPVASEVIAVDDCSTDRTLEILQSYHDPRLRVICHERNQGKGRGVQTALRHATGDLVIIQDADTEVSPRDYVRLLEPIEQGRARVVYGARDLKAQPLVGYLGNRFLTLVANWLGGLHLSDMETCYKLIPRELMLDLHLSAQRFDIEPEITMKLARRRVAICEVPISYYPRTDKKLHRLRDGLKTLVALVRFRFQD
jgi:glycosyltransferase involved in cell wall biosynthesis